MDSDIIIHGSRPMLGTSDFADLRQSDGLYVDKTALIREVVERGSKTLAYLRPRRFGKSLALSMLKCFLDCRDPRPELFEGLEIARDRAFWDRHFGKYPVILLSLKDMRMNTFEDNYAILVQTISWLVHSFAYLKDSPSLDDTDREQYERYRRGTADKAELCASLRWLSRMLCAHHGQRCVILLDEYDVPLNQAHLQGFYKEAIDVIRPLMGMALKDNEALRFGLVTGCLRIAKESIFTGLNHQDVHTVLTPESREWFGFSSEEVQAALAARGAAGRYSDVQKWYDGYRFGEHDVYNPWSIMNFLASVGPASPDGRLTTYWANTSGNDILARLLERSRQSDWFCGAFEGLFNDEPIVCRVTETITYADMYRTTDSIWSVMLFSGYLKPDGGDGGCCCNDCRLLLPNREVKELLRERVDDWLRGESHVQAGGQLSALLLEGRVQEAQSLIGELLLGTVSYYDYAEQFYHAFLAGLLAAPQNLEVRSNFEAGYGRADILLADRRRRRAAVLELKVAPSFDKLCDSARKGLDQIDARRYASVFSKIDGVKVFRYGVAFCRKACAVALADDQTPQDSPADGAAPHP